MLPVPPTIAFEITPSVAAPGEPITVVVHFHCDQPVEFRSIALRLRCWEFRHGALIPSSEALAVHFDQEKFLRDSPLPEGHSSFEWTVTLPKDHPPTFTDARTSIELKLSAHVDIPWWPDAHEERVIRVRAPMPKRRPQLAPYFATRIGREGPVIEMAFSPEYFVAGEAFECGVATRAFSRHGIESIALRLIAICEHRESDTKIESVVSEWTVSEQHVDDGEVARIRAALSDEIAGDFETSNTRLRHELEAVVQQLNGNIERLRAPCVVLEQPNHTGHGARPIALGRERSANLKAVVEMQLASLLDVAPTQAPSGEDASDVALGPLFALGVAVDPERGVVRWTQHGTRVEVRSAKHPTLGLCSRVELTFASLGIGLSIRKKARLDPGSDLIGFSDTFVSAYAIELRLRSQLNLFLAALLDEIACAFGADCAMNDESLVVWIPQADRDQSDLDRAIEPAFLLTDRVRRARAEIKAPDALARHVERWKRFAEKNAARFTVGDVSIRGWFVEGVELSLSHTFADGELEDIELSAKAPRECTAEDAEIVGAKIDNKRVAARGQELYVLVEQTTDPASVEPLARSLARAVKERYATDRGAYR